MCRVWCMAGRTASPFVLHRDTKPVPPICSEWSGGAFITWWDRRTRAGRNLCGKRIKRVGGCLSGRRTESSFAIRTSLHRSLPMMGTAVPSSHGRIPATSGSQTSTRSASTDSGILIGHPTVEKYRTRQVHSNSMIVNDGAGAHYRMAEPERRQFRTLRPSEFLSARRSQMGAAGTVICGARTRS